MLLTRKEISLSICNSYVEILKIIRFYYLNYYNINK